MKTTIEMHGYEIVISETEDGLLSVQAMKDGDVIEEFQLENAEEGLENAESEDGVKSFDDFGGEEEDFDREDEDEIEDEIEDDVDEMQDDDDENEGRTLESFQSFINKKK